MGGPLRDWRRTWRRGAAWGLFGLLALSFAAPSPGQAGTTSEGADGTVMSQHHLKASDSVRDVLEHPAFAGFSRLLLPNSRGRLDGDMPLRGIGSLLPYHSHIHVETTVQVLNFMIDEAAAGHTVFYDVYTAEQKALDAAKDETGLFFFRGRPGAPFAIVCPGGGFSYVGAIHEGFPLALELSKQGYNAFVLTYRVGSGQRATEDLAAAMSYVFRNAARLEVGTRDYSLWGGSAGARMVAYIGSHGSASFGGDNLPQPASIVMAYTGHSEFTKTDPPTFAMVSRDDPIVNASVVERRIDAMRSAGIDAEFHRYAHAGHGFGLGIGTDAEGWIRDALRFWEKHIQQ